MLDLITFKIIATCIVKSFVIVGRAFQDMFAVIRTKVVRQTTHKKNLIEFVGDTDFKTQRKKPRTSCPAPTTPFTVDVETGFFEVVDDQSLPPDTIARNRNDSTSPPPISKHEASLKKVTEESICSPLYQRTKYSTDSARDVFKTFVENARVVRARTKRHTILFGDDQKPGLAESVTTPSDNSLNAPNVFARTKLQQKRILCARTIRHEKLFGNKSCAGAGLSKSEGTDLALVVAALSVTIGDEVSVEPEAVDHETELDFGYFTADSYDDLSTPPSTPSRRARIVKSGSYGGSINYSLRRLSRNTDFEDIMLHEKQRYEVSPTLMIARHPIDS